MNSFFSRFALCGLILTSSAMAQDIPPKMESDMPYGQVYSDTPHDGWMATPTCETYPEWMGAPIGQVDLGILGDRPYRVLKPDSMATMDYSPDRLNIHTTDEGIIIQQDCG